jgi:hypothetical protein
MVALVGPVGIDLSEVRASPRARDGTHGAQFSGVPLGYTWASHPEVVHQTDNFRLAPTRGADPIFPA